MNADTDEGEKLEDYAVDVRELKHVHEQIVATKSEIEALVAKERKLGPLESLTDAQKEKLGQTVDEALYDCRRCVRADEVARKGGRNVARFLARQQGRLARTQERLALIGAETGETGMRVA